MRESRDHDRAVQRTGVLFVCLGNICRSPLAKVIFENMVAERGLVDRFDIDSCGTGGWHVGAAADRRSVEVAARNGLALRHRARQLDPESDFARFTFLLAMDRQNFRHLVDSGAPRGRVHLIRAFDPDLIGASENALDVPDPYEGADSGFDRVFEMLTNACAGFLDHVTGQSPLHH